MNMIYEMLFSCWNSFCNYKITI